MAVLYRIFRLWRHAPAILALFFTRGTSWKVRGIITLAVLYLFMPYDLIPDYIPGIGIVDDLMVITGLLALAQRFSQNKK